VTPYPLGYLKETPYLVLVYLIWALSGIANAQRNRATNVFMAAIDDFTSSVA